jgi:hypothetical protein
MNEQLREHPNNMSRRESSLTTDDATTHILIRFIESLSSFLESLEVISMSSNTNIHRLHTGGGAFDRSKCHSLSHEFSLQAGGDGGDVIVRELVAAVGERVLQVLVQVGVLVHKLLLLLVLHLHLHLLLLSVVVHVTSLHLLLLVVEGRKRHGGLHVATVHVVCVGVRHGIAVVAAVVHVARGRLLGEHLVIAVVASRHGHGHLLVRVAQLLCRGLQMKSMLCLCLLLLLLQVQHLLLLLLLLLCLNLLSCMCLLELLQGVNRLHREQRVLLLLCVRTHKPTTTGQTAMGRESRQTRHTTVDAVVDTGAHTVVVRGGKWWRHDGAGALARRGTVQCGRVAGRTRMRDDRLRGHHQLRLCVYRDLIARSHVVHRTGLEVVHTDRTHGTHSASHHHARGIDRSSCEAVGRHHRGDTRSHAGLVQLQQLLLLLLMELLVLHHLHLHGNLVGLRVLLRVGRVVALQLRKVRVEYCLLDVQTEPDHHEELQLEGVHLLRAHTAQLRVERVVVEQVVQVLRRHLHGRNQQTMDVQARQHDGLELDDAVDVDERDHEAGVRALGVLADAQQVGRHRHVGHTGRLELAHRRSRGGGAVRVHLRMSVGLKQVEAIGLVGFDQLHQHLGQHVDHRILDLVRTAVLRTHLFLRLG